MDRDICALPEGNSSKTNFALLFNSINKYKVLDDFNLDKYSVYNTHVYLRDFSVMAIEKQLITLVLTISHM